MKRSGPPKRYTALKRRTPLKRYTPLKRRTKAEKARRALSHRSAPVPGPRRWTLLRRVDCKPFFVKRTAWLPGSRDEDYAEERTDQPCVEPGNEGGASPGEKRVPEAAPLKRYPDLECYGDALDPLPAAGDLNPAAKAPLPISIQSLPEEPVRERIPGSADPTGHPKNQPQRSLARSSSGGPSEAVPLKGSEGLAGNQVPPPFPLPAAEVDGTLGNLGAFILFCVLLFAAFAILGGL